MSFNMIYVKRICIMHRIKRFYEQIYERFIFYIIFSYIKVPTT